MKVRFFSSIRFRIMLVVIVMISIPFAVQQGANLLLIYGQLQQKTGYTTEALAKSIATNVSAFMEGAWHASELLAEDPRVTGGTEEGRRALVEARQRMPQFLLFYAQGADGMQTIRSSGELANRSDRWWFRRMLEKPEGFVSEAYISVFNNELVSSIFLPLRMPDGSTGVFGADFTLETIRQATGQYWEDDISYLVLDDKGNVLTGSDSRPGEYINYIDYTRRTVQLDSHMRYTLDKDGQVVTRVEKISVSKAMKHIVTEALLNRSRTYQFREGNRIVVCAYQPILLPGASEPWSVIVFQKQTDFQTLAILGVLFALLISSSMYVTFRLINRHVLRPVLKIEQDMALIAQGNLDVRIDATRQDELGVLAGNIDLMVQALRAHQQRLDEDEKMVALGGLVAGVAHEINTPLGIGVTTASYMQKINQESRDALTGGRFTKQDLVAYMDGMAESLDMLQFNLERGSRIIQSFKRIAVDQSADTLETFLVRAYIEGILLSLAHETKRYRHEVEIRCDESLRIRSYPGVLAQILTNFVMNSLIHAFKDREQGHMLIEARREADRFVLVYADDGCGMREDVRKNIFKPYFTTRREMGGSGLGLSVVFNLVTKKLGGTIAVETGEDAGTRFEIIVPIKEDQADD